ncbi:MAG: MFS transporter [Actinomycetota bacterium]|nr:MFS transporter [Actinomycetota bacterium]
MATQNRAHEQLGRTTRAGLVIAIGVGFLVIFLTSSIKNVIPAYFVPMADYFGISRATFAVGPTVFMVVYGLMSPVVGAMADRFGGRNTITAGLVLAGGCFLTSAAVPLYALFTVLYGVGAAIAFAAVSYIPVGVLVEELFPPERRGLGYSILTNGTALGFIVLSPAWIILSRETGWRVVFATLGLAFLVPLALATHLLIPSSSPTQEISAEPVAPMSRRIALVLRTPGFWVLSGSFFGCGVTMGFIDVHVVAHMQEIQDSPTVISSAMIVLGVMEIVGSIVAGRLCDRFHGRYVLCGAYALRGLALLTLISVPDAFGSFTFAAVFGISYMGSVIATTLYALDIFDSKSKGMALGLIWLAHQFGAAISSEGGAVVFTEFGSYRIAIVGSAVIALVSLLLVALIEPKRSKKELKDSARQ